MNDFRLCLLGCAELRELILSESCVRLWGCLETEITVIWFEIGESGIFFIFDFVDGV